MTPRSDESPSSIVVIVAWAMVMVGAVIIAPKAQVEGVCVAVSVAALIPLIGALLRLHGRPPHYR